MKKGTAPLNEPAYAPVQGGHLAPLVSLKTWKTDRLFYISLILCFISLVILSVANESFKAHLYNQATDATTSFSVSNNGTLPAFIGILFAGGTCMYSLFSTAIFFKLTRLTLASFLVPNFLLIVVLSAVLIPSAIEDSKNPKFEVWAEQRYGIVLPEEKREMESDKYFIYNSKQLGQYHQTADNRWLIYGADGKELPVR